MGGVLDCEALYYIGIVVSSLFYAIECTLFLLISPRVVTIFHVPYIPVHYIYYIYITASRDSYSWNSH